MLRMYEQCLQGAHLIVGTGSSLVSNNSPKRDDISLRCWNASAAASCVWLGSLSSVVRGSALMLT